MAGIAAMLDTGTVSQRKAFIEKATELKNYGNERYRKLLEECKKPVDQRDKATVQISLKEAKRFYHMARLQAQAAYPFNPDSFKKEQGSDGASKSATDENALMRNECYDLIASIYNNLAAVILAAPEGQKTGDYERAAEYCSYVLLIQLENSKAMYRKAQALEKLGHLKRALTFYRDADLIEKHENTTIQRDLARLKRQLADAKVQSKDELKENFRRGMSKCGLGLAADVVQYGKREKRKKKVRKRYSDSPSRGSSCSSSSSSNSHSSSSGRSSDEE